MLNNTETQKSNRSFYFDNIKGILILLVVFGHFVLDADCLSGLSIPLFTVIWSFIYVFHMPAFVFVSGFFGRKVFNSSIDKREKNLIFIGLSYFVIQTLFTIYDYSKGNTIDILVPLYSGWYLLALFIWRLVTPKLSKHKIILPASIFMSIVIGFIPQLDRTLAIGRIISFYPFYLAGFLLDFERVESLRNSLRKTRQDLICSLVLILAGLGSAMYLAMRKPGLEVLTMGAYQNLADAFYRVIIFIVAGTITLGLIIVVPDVKVCLLTRIGKGSFTVYLFHRFFVFAFFGYCYKHLLFLSVTDMLVVFATISLVISVVLSIDRVDRVVRDFFVVDFARLSYKPFVYSALSISLIAVLLIQNLPLLFDSESSVKEISKANDFNQVMSDVQKLQFEDSYRLLFAGDLILLEDQVKKGFDGTDYNYDDMFEYTSKYIESADLAIGVFEGPMGGDEVPYSQGNYDDGKKLYLSYPDSFAEAIQDAGFDLVTLANNHLMDRGLDSALRTIDVLDEIGLNHVGAYKNEEDKNSNSVKLIEEDGISFAILSYTFNFNYCTDSDIMGDLNFLSSYLVAPESEYCDSVKKTISEDFDFAKSLNVDFIIVLPHMGTQFQDYPDYYQTFWCDYFVELGADIILADHTHSVQPAFIDTSTGKNVFIGYCPGNYANIYRDYNGDCSILTEVYIDKESKTVTGGSIIPMWVTADSESNYRPIPIYDLVNNPEISDSLTIYDLERVEEVQRHITSVVMGVEIGLDASRERYYFDSNGYLREKASPMEISEDMAEGKLYELLTQAENVCFLGDSITCGSNNYGYPWFEPLEHLVKGEVVNISRGGYTASMLLNLMKESDLKDSDLFVVAIGTNDVRYNNPNICALTSEEYINRIDAITTYILEYNSSAKIVYIAPWMSFENDPNINVPYEEAMEKNCIFSEALESYCSTNSFVYINPNRMIEETISVCSQKEYLVDWIHPNMNKGIELYSSAVLLYEA